jgi:hypothetical protein
MIIMTYSLLFWPIDTQRCGNAELSNNLPRIVLMILKLLYHAEWIITPAIVRFRNQFSHPTSHYFLLMFFQVRFLVKHHIEPGEYILTHSVPHALHSLTPPCFLYSNLHIGQINLVTFRAAVIVNNSYHFHLNSGRFLWFVGHFLLCFGLQRGSLRSQLLASVIIPTIYLQRQHHLQCMTQMLWWYL